MTETPRTNPSAQEMTQKLKTLMAEADGLFSSERYPEAIAAYESLVREVHAWLMDMTKKGQKPGPSAKKTLRVIENRILAAREKMAVAEKSRPVLDIQAFKLRLQNAEGYTQRHLIAEAKKIYTLLFEQVRSWLSQQAEALPETIYAAQRTLKILKSRLNDLQEMETYLSSGETSHHSTPAERVLEDRQAVLWLAVALCGCRLSSETVQALEKSEPVRASNFQAVEQLADFLVSHEDLSLGRDLYRNLIRQPEVSAKTRGLLLWKLAQVNESMGIFGEAIRNYREIIRLEPAHAEAAERLEFLRREAQKIRFSIATVTDHPWLFFGLSVMVALFFMAFMPLTKTVNNVDYFTLEKDPHIAYYEEFKEVFGNDEFFVIAFEKPDIFTQENLTLLSDITQDLETVEEAKEVKSLANVNDVIGEEDFFEVREFLEEIPEDPEDLRALKEQAIGNPLYIDALISRDGRTASIVVEAYDLPDDDDYRVRLMEKARAVLDEYSDSVDAFYIAGWTYTNLSLSQFMKQDVARFIPITYLFITLAIWLVFRNIILTALAITNISVCVGSVMGLMGLTGITLNTVTSIIPSMVMALALCDTVHIFSHMDQRALSQAGGDRRKALAGVLKRVVLPSFLTSLTTAIGFLSQGISQIPPIRDFAWIASAGMLFEFVYSFFLLPPLILLFKPERIYQSYESTRGITLLLNSVFLIVRRYHKAIAFCIVALILTAGWYAMQIRAETNTIGYFKKSSELRQAMDFVESRLGGIDSMDISVTADRLDAFKDPANLLLLEKAQKYLESLPGIDSTVSFVDFIKDMNESFHNENPEYFKIPESQEMVAQYLLLYNADDIENVITNTYDHARIGIQLSIHSSAEQAKLINKIRDYIEKNFQTEGLEFRVTGRALKDVVTINALVNGQLYSLGLATAVITLIMFLALRSISIGFLSVIPNSFPIVVNFGIMGALGIPLDTGTAIIAAVAIGIAVDDTMHFLSEYKIQRDMNMRVAPAIRAVLLIKGRALFSSSLILCIGFSVLVLSHFVPTMNFGILTAIIMLTALIGDIVFLPSLIMFKAEKPHRSVVA